MGIGPSIAIPMVLKNAGIMKEDVDLFEVGRIRDHLLLRHALNSL
jgi:acetyl-CoA acetyltransferase